MYNVLLNKNLKSLISISHNQGSYIHANAYQINLNFYFNLVKLFKNNLYLFVNYIILVAYF